MDVELLEGNADAFYKDAEARETDAPLCVDLDGTLISSDILFESFFALLKRNPLYLLLIPFWLMKGKAHLKHEIAVRVELDPALLPYREDLLEYLREQRGAGRRLVLATAADQALARRIADHLGLFDDVLASDGATNLEGAAKAQRLRALFGEHGFDYAGNSSADFPVWSAARHAVLVSPEPRVRRAARRMDNIKKVFDGPRRRARDYLRAMRSHQWVKNLLVFVPLVAGHEVGSPELLTAALLGFVAFSLCASSVYLLNDLLDLNADRRHASKRLRPFASGAVPLAHGALMAPLLLIAAFGVAAALPGEFVAALAVYYVVTLAYSFWLKRMLILDVLALAGLYTLRIIAGGAAVAADPSFWLLAFSMFLFFGLAIVKRASELIPLQNSEKVVKVRSYQPVDLDALTSLGVPSGHMAVLVLALYINSDDIVRMYTHPRLIWLLCPLLLYWLARVWLLTWRGRMHDDPVVFALKDKTSLLLAAVALGILAAAL